MGGGCEVARPRPAHCDLCSPIPDDRRTWETTRRRNARGVSGRERATSGPSAGAPPKLAAHHCTKPRRPVLHNALSAADHWVCVFFVTPGSLKTLSQGNHRSRSWVSRHGCSTSRSECRCWASSQRLLPRNRCPGLKRWRPPLRNTPQGFDCGGRPWPVRSSINRIVAREKPPNARSCTIFHMSGL